MTKQPSKKPGGRPKELEDPKKILLAIESADLESMKSLAQRRKESVRAIIRRYIKDGLAREATE